MDTGNQTAPTERLKGFCLVKQEFQLGWDFKNPFENEKKERDSKKRKRKGMNKGRKKKDLGLSEKQEKKDQICFKIAMSETCDNETCKYSHDVEQYLASREPDIGEVCPLFNRFGYCNYGVKCLFSKGHDTSNKPSSPSTTYSDHVQNVVPYESIAQLRKKKYSFELKQDKFEKPKQPLDFKGKVYVAPLTTVGNLPFRRIVKEFGADITCGEMALARNLLEGKLSEWALVKRHKSEDFFGIQLADSDPNVMSRCALLLQNEVNFDFIDLNLGCPIDLITKHGAGSALMNRKNKLKLMLERINSTTNQQIRIGVKMRLGWNSNKPTAHKLCQSIQKWKYENSTGEDLNLAYVAIHGRSRQQRYTKLADWNYIHQTCSRVKAQAILDNSLPLNVIGNGDIMSYTQWYQELERTETLQSVLQELNEDRETETSSTSTSSLSSSSTSTSSLSTIMLARGALIKPWICQEIKEKRHIDISASERMSMLKKFVDYGLCHWGTDRKGINNTRRYLLEWMSFLYRYVPIGILEKNYIPQNINDRPPKYHGRCETETLLCSPNVKDWIKITEKYLGKVDNDFKFLPKHRANAYEEPTEGISKILGLKSV